LRQILLFHYARLTAPPAVEHPFRVV
jgi:hypothetical protein